jgi:hypothetical protein
MWTHLRTLTMTMVAGFAASAASAQEVPRWAVAAEGGVSDIHGRTEAEGGAAALRLQRRVAGFDWIRAEAAFTAGWADEDFQTAELGVELRLCASCRITGFIGGGGGFLNEPDWNGGMLRASAGFEVRVTQRFAFRAFGQVGTHDGVRGPHLGMVGVAYRFGATARPASSP